jgi:chromosome partitioning protein
VNLSTKVIAFFNNKGGVGKTSLVYHLAWMYADLGLRVVAADLDPQANLTSAFLDEDRLEQLWRNPGETDTIFAAIRPLLRGTGDIANPHLESISYGDSIIGLQLSLFGHSSNQLALFSDTTSHLALIVGDLALSRFEDQLSEVWPKCSDGDERAFRVISAFWRIMQNAAARHTADVILVDLGPNLGAINRAALIAADYVVVPLSPDLFSLQGLRNLGPTLRRWRKEWKDRRTKNPTAELLLPSGNMEPAGYIILQHSVRMDRPVKAYDRWIARVPQEYRESVLNQSGKANVTVENDPHKLALLKHYRSLMPMAQEARKPMYWLKPADGAIGSHVQAVHSAYKDFHQMALAIGEQTGLVVPQIIA